MLDDFDFAKIQDLSSARQCIKELLNLVEELKGEVDKLRVENQRLRDEINRLKGEQGKPKIKPNKKEKSTSRDFSSENERHETKEHKKGSKLERVKIDRTEERDVDPKLLPADAEFKGYEDVVVQDIKIQTENTLFRKKKYYSPSEGKTYMPPCPRATRGNSVPLSKPGP